MIDVPEETYLEIQSFEYQFGYWETDCWGSLNEQCKCGLERLCHDELTIQSGGIKTTLNESGKWKEKIKITHQGLSLELDPSTKQ